MGTEYQVRRNGQDITIIHEPLRRTKVSEVNEMAYRISRAMGTRERLVVTLKDSTLIAGVPVHAFHDLIKRPKDAPLEFSTMTYELDTGQRFVLNDVRMVE